MSEQQSILSHNLKVTLEYCIHLSREEIVYIGKVIYVKPTGTKYWLSYVGEGVVPLDEFDKLIFSLKSVGGIFILVTQKYLITLLCSRVLFSSFYLKSCVWIRGIKNILQSVQRYNTYVYLWTGVLYLWTEHSFCHIKFN